MLSFRKSIRNLLCAQKTMQTTKLRYTLFQTMKFPWKVSKWSGSLRSTRVVPLQKKSFISHPFEYSFICFSTSDSFPLDLRLFTERYFLFVERRIVTCTILKDQTLLSPKTAVSLTRVKDLSPYLTRHSKQLGIELFSP